MYQQRSAARLAMRAAAIAAVALVLGFVGFRLSEDVGIAALADKGRQRLDLCETSLEREIEKYAYFPATLGLERDVLDLVVNGGEERAHRIDLYLEQLNQRAGSLSIYVLDAHGRVVASSNWNRPDSFVGEDLTYRSYVGEAMAGRNGRFFGIGTTVGEPGYYLSSPLVVDGRPQGVAVVKVSLEQLETSWATVEAPVLVSDENGVVILASVPSWKFTALSPLAEETRAGLARSLRYNARPLPPLGLVADRRLDGRDATLVTLIRPAVEGTSVFPVSGRFLAQSVPLVGNRWTLTVLSPSGDVRSMALTRGALAAVAGACIGMAGAAFLQHRARLAERARAREALQRAHDDLERKVEERTRTLAAAQDELVHAGKLAVIGQMAAGLAHELNQPLAALQTLSANTVRYLGRGDLPVVEENLGFIGEMVERMARLTGQLRSFARKSTGAPSPVAVGHAVDTALFILQRRIAADGVAVSIDVAADAVVLCDPIRLEQVFVNLVANALDAVAGRPSPRLWVTAERRGVRVSVTVRDDGPGLGEAVLARLFEPFFTTKENGAGLGLGLAISAGIVHDFDGTLAAADHPEGGAVFTVDLPAAEVGDHS